MKFTYEAYLNLVDRLKKKNYAFANYHNYRQYDRCVVLRHDIDYDISKAVKLAEIEQMGGVVSTYFMLLTSDFYNIFSKESLKGIQKIIDCGHEIGLHFDEVRYSEQNNDLVSVSRYIKTEAEILGQAINRKIDVVSMHRPSKGLLESDLEIPGLINTYNYMFFREFKYLSDSRRRWREPIEEIVDSNQYNRIHLLTHAFWYNDEECDIHDSVSRFINDGNKCRYRWFADNITELGSIMNSNEIR